MANLMRMPVAMRELDVYGKFTDFIEDQADTEWVDTVTDTGTVLFGDAAGGEAVLTPSDCTVGDNDEVYLASPNEVFKLAAGKPMFGTARLKFSEVTANKFNYGMFFQNAVGANSIVDNGAGLKVSGDCLGIYKIDGSDGKLRCVSVVNGATAIVSTSGFSPVAGTYYVFGIEVVDLSPTQVQIIFTVDGVTLKDDTTGLPIVHTWAFASSTEMQFAIGGKLGAATNNDKVTADYMGAWQAR